jgi:hypothetical protein
MIRPQAPDDLDNAPDWTLPTDEVDITPAAVVPLLEALVDPAGARPAWCPECGARHPMQFTVTPDGTRYDHCTGCGLLWHVDRETGVVVGTRLVSPQDVGMS